MVWRISLWFSCESLAYPRSSPQQALFGSTPSVSIGVSWKDAEHRKKTTTPATGDTSLYIFESGDDVEGEVKISVPGGKKAEHGGVRIELKGVIEFAGEKVMSHDVMSLSQDLAMSGMFSAIQTLPFSFKCVEFPYETYLSSNVKVRFFAKITILKSGSFGSSNIVQTFEFLVQNPQFPPSVEEDSDIKLEVGIEDCLHIEFQYDRYVLFPRGDIFHFSYSCLFFGFQHQVSFGGPSYWTNWFSFGPD